MGIKILQWNCGGIRINYKELLLLLNKYNPKVVCIQKIFLKDKNQLNIKHFLSYNHLYKDRHRASEGVSILIRKNIPQQQINIDSELQVIADKTTLHKSVDICSIYILSHDPINDKNLDKLIEQISKPHILLGDLNSHNTLWGCLRTNKKGTDLEKVINSNNLCILNDNYKCFMYLWNVTCLYFCLLHFSILWFKIKTQCTNDFFLNRLIMICFYVFQGSFFFYCLLHPKFCLDQFSPTSWSLCCPLLWYWCSCFCSFYCDRGHGSTSVGHRSILHVCETQGQSFFFLLTTQYYIMFVVPCLQTQVVFFCFTGLSTVKTRHCKKDKIFYASLLSFFASLYLTKRGLLTQGETTQNKKKLLQLFKQLQCYLCKCSKCHIQFNWKFMFNFFKCWYYN